MTNFTHNSTGGLANSFFSTTKHLSEAEKDALFIKYTNERTSTEPGNIIPHFWYQVIVDEKRRPDLTAINVMSEIFALYRFSASLCSSFYKNPHDMPILIDKSLRISYEHFTKKFGFPDEKTRRGLITLEELGIIRRNVSNICMGNGKRCNKLLITLNPDFFLSCFRDPNKDIRASQKEMFSPSRKKKSQSNNNDCKANDTIENRVNDNKYQSSEISGDLISNKSFKKDRSTRGSNFSKISEKSNSETSGNIPETKEEAITTTPIAQNQPKVRLLEQTRKYEKSKTLADFYPLTKKDCVQFQISCGREFDLNAMNEILLSMSRKGLEVSFYHRNGFIGYMTKAYLYEMRDAVKISNGTYKIKSNLTEEEKKEEEAEKYLIEIEKSGQVSPEWHLKKKLANTLAKSTAYALLKAYKRIVIEGNTAKLILHQAVDLTPLEYETLLRETKATHERFEGSQNRYINKIELIVSKIKSSLPAAASKVAEIPNTVWGEVRRQLIDVYGQALDGHWFSKLEGIVDEEKKTIEIKTPSSFFQKYVKDNYLQTIENIVKKMDLSVHGVTC